MGAGDRGRHDVAAFAAAAALSSARAAATALGVAGGAPGLQARDLLGLDRGVDGQDAAVLAGGERRGLGLGEAVDADDGLLAGLDGGEAGGVALSTRRLFM